MISVKYYSSWLKEAGRGHLTLALSWGGFLAYTIVSILQISMDAENNFFGIGSSGLLRLCMGLGILLAAAEFFYLLSPARQDFYYSLPVRKGTIFWCRYVYGILHFFAPFILSMCICALYESSADSRFPEEAGAYTVRSILVFGAIFLLFYHLGIFAVAASGRVVSAIGMLVLEMFYVQVVFRCGAVYGKKLFDCFYRIPVWEKLEELLNVQCLAGKVSGGELYEMRAVWEYVPEKELSAAAVCWILVLFFSFFLMQKKRKAETVGRVFVFPAAERAIVFLVSVLAAFGAGSAVLLAFGPSEGGGIRSMKLAAALITAGLAALALVHVLAWRFLRQPGNNESGRRKRHLVQLAAEGLAACAVIGGFYAAAPRFDRYLPDKEQVEQVAICVNGLGMGREECGERKPGEISYTVEERLKQYELKEDGRGVCLDWIYGMRKKETAGEPYTFATVCYSMKDGREIYRAYPVDEESFRDFSAVYESTEYKEKAYPVMLKEEASEERFVWTDGAVKQTLKLSGEEKEELLKACQEDICGLTMEQLKGEAPCGMLQIESQIKGRVLRVYVYSFFEKTCGYLEQQGIHPEKDLFDYAVHSVFVRETPDGSYGGNYSQTGGTWCTAAEEIEAWRGKLICRDFDVQALLCPLGYSTEADVMIEEPESGALAEIDCYGR